MLGVPCSRHGLCLEWGGVAGTQFQWKGQEWLGTATSTPPILTHKQACCHPSACLCG